MQTAALILVGYIGLACAITVLWIGFHWVPTRGHVDRGLKQRAPKPGTLRFAVGRFNPTAGKLELKEPWPYI